MFYCLHGDLSWSPITHAPNVGGPCSLEEYMIKRMLTLAAASVAITIGLASCASGPSPAALMSEKVQGSWTMNAFYTNKVNVIGTTFDTGTLNLDWARRKATFTLELKRSTIDAKLADWKKDYPDLKIDSYKIIADATWRFDKKAETIFFDYEDSNIEIRGSGANYEGFLAWELSKFAISKSAKQSTGLLSGIVGAVAGAVTKTEDYFVKPEFGVGYWIFDLSGNAMTLDTKTGAKITLSR